MTNISVSVVIPSYNGKFLLEKNLPAVFRSLAFIGSAEIIVVDDASTDGTIEWLAQNYPLVKVVRNKNNLRFAESCNRGVKAARGGIVILLNNDVKPEKHLLSAILPHFTNQLVFAVSFREINSSDGRLIGGLGIMAFKKGLMVHWRPEKQNKTVEAMWVSGGSAAFRRDLWQKLGGFDNLFRPAYEEDRDLCWQALKAGYKIIFEPKAIVEHYHETTNRQVFGKAGISLYSFNNQILFVWKNISSSRLLFNHLLWFPYHLILTTWRTRGIFLISLLLALSQLPEALISRKRAAKLWRISDEEILSLV